MNLRAQRLLAQLSLAALVGFGGSIAISQFERWRGREGRRTAVRQGADAATPVEIPAGGWSAIARRTYDEVGKDRVLAVAAGVTFYGLLAKPPTVRM